MHWDRALEEIHRVVKAGGAFILIDHFAAAFNPLFPHKYLAGWLRTRLHHIRNRNYHKKLSALCRSGAWREMVKAHPGRNLSEALRCIEKSFISRSAGC
jgi:ubiquinone/menaquinone biosynthesis C-methylase UbiE